MDKARIEQRIIELARAFAGLDTYMPSARQADRDAACILRGELNALFSYIAAEKKNRVTP